MPPGLSKARSGSAYRGCGSESLGEKAAKTLISLDVEAAEALAAAILAMQLRYRSGRP